jgi:hypothetical protein
MVGEKSKPPNLVHITPENASHIRRSCAIESIRIEATDTSKKNSRIISLKSVLLRRFNSKIESGATLK